MFDKCLKSILKYNWNTNLLSTKILFCSPFSTVWSYFVEHLILLWPYCSHSVIKHFILGLRNVLPITTAKVPIVKFFHVRSGLEVDISLYNTLVRLSPSIIFFFNRKMWVCFLRLKWLFCWDSIINCFQLPVAVLDFQTIVFIWLSGVSCTMATLEFSLL